MNRQRLRRNILAAWRVAAKLGVRVEHRPVEQRFRAMTEGTAADWTGIHLADAAFARKTPDRLVTVLRMLEGEPHAFTIDRLQHGLQTATRAYRDGRDEGYVACALLHDIGAAIAPADHPAIAAAILRPHVSEADLWMVEHHDVFQGYYFAEHLGRDPNARERYRGHPHFERTAQFCHLYDQASFDPDYPTMPLEAFRPLLGRVMERWR